jgi:hypothetical protein
MASLIRLSLIARLEWLFANYYAQKRPFKLSIFTHESRLVGRKRMQVKLDHFTGHGPAYEIFARIELPNELKTDWPTIFSVDSKTTEVRVTQAGMIVITTNDSEIRFPMEYLRNLIDGNTGEIALFEHSVVVEPQPDLKTV